MAGLTLDSGALIAYGRSERRVMVHLKEAILRGVGLTVPAVTVAEVWRGGARSARLATLFEACSVERLDESLARIAGEAIGKVKRAGVADAIVMASAAQRGDAVLTSHSRDLMRLRAYFPTVRVVAM